MNQENSERICVGVASSASPVEVASFERGVSALKNAGFNVCYSPTVLRRKNYLAGTDKERIDELVSLFEDSNVDVIMFSRGGYGSQRIIDDLPWGKIKKNNKPVIGFSDFTPLLNKLHQNGCPTYYGPPVAMLGKDDRTDLALFNLLNGEKTYEFLTDESIVLKEGRAEGITLGGCLTLISSSIGTDYEFKFKDSLLVVEEVGEKVYSIDRIFTQLLNSGAMKKVKGVVGGKFTLPNGEEGFLEMIEDRLSEINGPIVFNLSFGHEHPFYPVPLNVKANLEAKGDTVKLTFGDHKWL